MTYLTSKGSNSTNIDYPVNGYKIRVIRSNSRMPNKKKMTQQYLADKALVSRSYIAQIERGTKTPRLLVAQSIADALGVELESIALDS